jgi:predicted AAA+ superfamily ATPase
MGGSLMETVVLMEIVKTLVGRGEDPAVYFWRTSAGSEVDFVVEHGGELVPIEVKLSSTARPAMANEIRAFQGEFGKKAAPGYVVHPGDTRLPLAKNVTALPFGEL